MGNEKTENTTKMDLPFRARTIVAIVASLITTIILDISLLRVYNIISKEFVSLETRELIFAAITVSCLTSMYLLLHVLKPARKANERKSESIARLSFYATTGIQVVLGALIIFVVSQILLLSYYDVSGILSAILFSYTLCIAILGILISRIVSSFRPKKSLLVIIFFVIGLGSIIFNVTVAMVDAFLRLTDRPPQTRPSLGASVDVSKGRFDTIDYLYFSSYVLSYLTAWIATATLMHHYSRRIGRVKYSLLLISPLAFFLMQFSGSFVNGISPTSLNQFFLASLVTLIISFSKPIGGLMLGIGFWTMARFARKDSPVRFYLIISGFGMLLLFTSNQAILLSIAPYPPFGLATISAMGISSYLILLGIYSSSVSVSNDDRLRREIRQIAKSETKLIEEFISGEKRKEIEARVIQQVLEIEDETGSKPSMTDEEIKQYLDQILREVKRE